MGLVVDWLDGNVGDETRAMRVRRVGLAWGETRVERLVRVQASRFSVGGRAECGRPRCVWKGVGVALRGLHAWSGRRDLTRVEGVGGCSSTERDGHAARCTGRQRSDTTTLPCPSTLPPFPAPPVPVPFASLVPLVPVSLRRGRVRCCRCCRPLSALRDAEAARIEQTKGQARRGEARAAVRIEGRGFASLLRTARSMCERRAAGDRWSMFATLVCWLAAPLPSFPSSGG